VEQTSRARFANASTDYEPSACVITNYGE